MTSWWSGPADETEVAVTRRSRRAAVARVGVIALVAVRAGGRRRDPPDQRTAIAPSSGGPQAPPSQEPAACPARSGIQALVDAAAPGATVTVPPCLARETVKIDKPLTLNGQPGAEIRGSDVWTAWTAAGPPG